MSYIGSPIESKQGVDLRFLDYIQENSNEQPKKTNRCALSYDPNTDPDVLLGIRQAPEKNKEIKELETKTSWWKFW